MSGHRRRLYDRRQVLAGAGGLAATLVLAGCGDGEPRPSSTSTPGTTPPSPSPSDSPLPSASAVPLEEMVGQMLMLGFRGTTLQAGNPIVADLRERHVGAVVLYSRDVTSGEPVRNIASPQQLTQLTAELREEAGSRLLIATDQEGGPVARLGPEHGFPATRSAQELAALGDPEATYGAALEMARTLREAGINLNLAPVVDVDTNPDNPIIGALGRSFSADPDVVTRQAAAFVRAHREAGVLTCLKHFPGHGSSEGDTHEGFVDVTDTWTSVELEPYRELVGTGLADTVMVAHVFNADLDPQYPASLSRATITGLLREEIGFDGVVISDDLQMRAITEQWGFEEAIRLAVHAGTDVLAFSNNIDVFEPELGVRAQETLLGLVRSGEIDEARVAQSYDRITALKDRLA